MLCNELLAVPAILIFTLIELFIIDQRKNYYVTKVTQVFQILQANLAKQESRLAVASAELNKAQAQLDEKQAELDKVQAMYDAAMAEKQILLDDAESCRRRMQAASALIGGLGGEKVRWTEQSKQFKAQIER